MTRLTAATGRALAKVLASLTAGTSFHLAEGTMVGEWGSAIPSYPTNSATAGNLLALFGWRARERRAECLVAVPAGLNGRG
jgi:hypothetical protein